MKFIFPCFILVFLVSCTTIDKQQAESIALDFVKSRVIFYAKENNTPQTLQQYFSEVASSDKIGDKWYITVQISTFVNGTAKEKSLPIVVSASSGQVIEFNNRPVK
jgi:hypothetical protein